jgi:hypothetical protein
MALIEPTSARSTLGNPIEPRQLDRVAAEVAARAPVREMPATLESLAWGGVTEWGAVQIVAASATDRDCAETDVAEGDLALAGPGLSRAVVRRPDPFERHLRRVAGWRTLRRPSGTLWT